MPFGTPDIIMSVEGFDDLMAWAQQMIEGDLEYSHFITTIVVYAAWNEAKNQAFMEPAVQSLNSSVGQGLISAGKRVGVNAMTKALNNHDPDVLREAAKNLALEVKRRARELAPVDTGNLMRSIATGPTLQQAREKSRNQTIQGFRPGGAGNVTSPEEILP